MTLVGLMLFATIWGFWVMTSKSIKKISVLDKNISLYLVEAEDYISLTEIAKFKNPKLQPILLKTGYVVKIP
jgi:hypothetical protein